MKNLFLGLFGAVAFAAIFILSSCNKPADNTAATTETTPSGSTSENTGKQPIADPGAASVDADEKFQTTRGTFKEIQWGDYAHFVMIDEKGEEVDFWIAGDLPNETVEKYESSKAKGTKIEIKWRSVMRDIPESGGKMELEEVFEVKEI